MDIKNISITVDDRERASGTVELLRDFSGVEVTVERLDIGDYSVDDCLLFERKTLSDFAVSVVQGRFFRQCLGLMESGRRGVIVLEGKAGDLVRFGIGREALQGALISASVIMGLAVLRSCGPQETVRLIVHAGRQAARHVSGGVQRHGYRPRGRRRRQLFVLQGLPGVGPERARALLERFGSVEAIISAATEELMQTPGIGKETAEGIRSIVAEQPARYTAGEVDNELLFGL